MIQSDNVKDWNIRRTTRSKFVIRMQCGDHLQFAYLMRNGHIDYDFPHLIPQSIKDYVRKAFYVGRARDKIITMPDSTTFFPVKKHE